MSESERADGQTSGRKNTECFRKKTVIFRIYFILSSVFSVLTSVLCVLQLSVLQAGALGANSCNADGFTPLHVAALHGHSALVALLIRHGANVNGRTNQSATPLHLASQNSHVQVGAKHDG